jgi:GNAT superfamily N-acetyltransferase
MNRASDADPDDTLACRAIRTAGPGDAAGIARVHVDGWRSTYAGIVPQAFLDNLSYAQREAYWRRLLEAEKGEHCLFVADDAAHGIVGFSHGATERTGHPVYVGELYALYVLGPFQGRGLGRALTLAVVEWFIERGIRSMLVWVLAKNPTRRFYEALGGQLVEVKRICIGEAELEEVAYGWTDITRLPRAHT